MIISYGPNMWGRFIVMTNTNASLSSSLNVLCMYLCRTSGAAKRQVNLILANKICVLYIELNFNYFRQKEVISVKDVLYYLRDWCGS